MKDYTEFFRALGRDDEWHCRKSSHRSLARCYLLPVTCDHEND